jgi:sensor c-di-GMP phosphodiesterase-like protein
VVCSAIFVAIVVKLANRRLSMRTELQIALRRHEFTVHYQPIVSLENGACLGAEALLRWRRRDGSLMRPDLFIPAAEETGLIRPITVQIIESVADEMGALLGERDLWISINIAPADLVDENAIALFEEALSRTGLPRSQISFEATESVRLNPDKACPMIARLRDAGHKVIIDDFGTGYSNLSYLQTLGVDGLKMDKSFVDAIGEGAATSPVVTHIAALAAALGLKTVAEGVETEAQADFLRAQGVAFAQGWLYAKAMPADEFHAFVVAHGRPVRDVPEISESAFVS